MTNIIVVIIVAIITGGIGTILGGIIYDVVWYAGDYASVNINKCDTMPQDWKVQCENVKSDYETGKNIIHLISGISPFIVILLFFIREF